MTSEPHPPYIDKFFPEPYKAMLNVTKTLRKIYPDVDLGEDLIELINVRVSQINGCGTCLSLHVPQALKAGVPQWKLDVLAAWRMVEDFSKQERAALELAESLTLLQEGKGHTAGLKACEVFAEEQVAALEWAIVTINAFNRISIASVHPLLGKRKN
ncbi:Carboxymuconolactone decarboxylase family protein [Corynebacterium occultum]|uniref:Carboxymuconolactone decarboxylase family protein n=1 Tax=Corynebacterium occultum TaxID=2675219 RepID=A0A6B8WB43_9CORY|nr:carboxymuconolactone decarboxylase family protein [Corynebacterium occultum]QGU08046.1 Carboxymuconolactone decarboxylase family protein [Corynebacterium occultum]